MRFLTADPVGVAGGINLYAYVGGDPVNYNDPSGLFPTLPDPRNPNDDVTAYTCRPHDDGCGLLQAIQTSWMWMQGLDFWGDPIDSLSCPTGGHGEWSGFSGRNYGPASGAASDFVSNFNQTELAMNAHSIAVATDREIAFAFNISDGDIILNSATWGPAGTRNSSSRVRGGSGRISVNGDFGRGPAYLFHHYHGRNPSGGGAGLSGNSTRGDLYISATLGIPVASVEGDGRVFFAASAEANDR